MAKKTTAAAAKKGEKSQAGKKRTSKRKPSARKTGVTENDIRREAYFNFLGRGGADGFHEEDWYRAEKKFKPGHQRKAKKKT